MRAKARNTSGFGLTLNNQYILYAPTLKYAYRPDQWYKR
jgi:hypothetical protein